MSDLNKLRVVDLKGHLVEAGLSTSGRKADLVERLRKYRSSESESESQEENKPIDDIKPPLEELQLPLEELQPPLEDSKPPLEELQQALEDIKPIVDIKPPQEFTEPPQEVAISEVAEPEVTVPPPEVVPPAQKMERMKLEFQTSLGGEADPHKALRMLRDKKRSEVAGSGVTEPEVAEPEVTKPEVTEPEVTEPEITEPEVMEPEVTEPEVTGSEVAKPDVTEPEVAEPEVAESEVTEPEVTMPEVTEPEVTEPEVTMPEVTEPEVTEPEVAEPEVTEPEVTEPEVTELEVTEPEVTEPEVTGPEVTEPEVTEPEVTEPEVTELEVTEPEVTGSEVTEPEVTEPSPKVVEPPQEVPMPEVTAPPVEVAVPPPEVTKPPPEVTEVTAPPVEVTKPPPEGVSSLEELDARTKLEKMKLEVLRSLGGEADPHKVRRMLRNKKKRLRKKRGRGKGAAVERGPQGGPEEVEVEYVTQDPDFNDPNLFMFRKIFKAFQIADEVATLKEEVSVAVKETKSEKVKNFEDSSDDEERIEDKDRVSKKKLRKLNRLSVAELKQLVIRPDVVEMHDVTAHDPRLLVHLKATRNSVTVPRHWCFKRKYLQGKRGFEKPAFELPECIRNTGIMEMRQALQEKEDSRTLKSKVREKVRPKLGKIDIDYQKLHDAFFRYQTKPRMTAHGDLYYEGKEFETRLKEKKPGNLSEELRAALGMPVGSGAAKIPPPWLIAMQRYGPPPSYPILKIQGLNCPIPESCSFGYHAGGWGKPPVDEHGRPLYGDVFGTQGSEVGEGRHDDDIDRSLWGDLESESEDSSSEEEEAEEADETGVMTPAGESGVATPSGISTVPTGMETPDMIELRKRKIEDQMEGGETPQLFQVLPEKSGAAGARAMMGSAHTYEVPAREGIDVTLNPEELELDSVAMAAKYEARVREQEGGGEDFSDMVADHAAKQRKKRKSQAPDNKPTKKYKEFKF